MNTKGLTGNAAIIRSIDTNSRALGRNHAMADSAVMVSGSDWHRVELHWNDGAFMAITYDTRDEALDHLSRLGFFRMPPEGTDK